MYGVGRVVQNLQAWHALDTCGSDHYYAAYVIDPDGYRSRRIAKPLIRVEGELP
jgi:hypothetical protein